MTSKGPKNEGPKKPAKALVPKGPGKIVAETTDERRAARNVAQIRTKLAAAMEDPHVREQIARAMRQLINEEK
jgi:hypothetical protein